MELKNKKITAKEIKKCFKILGENKFLSKIYFDKDKLGYDIYMDIKDESYNSFIHSCLIEKVTDKLFFLVFCSRTIPQYGQYELLNYKLIPTMRVESIEELCQNIFDYFTGNKKIQVCFVARIWKDKKEFKGYMVDFKNCVFKGKDFYKCIKNGEKELFKYVKDSIKSTGRLPHPIIYLDMSKKQEELNKNKKLEEYFISITTEIK